MLDSIPSDVRSHSRVLMETKAWLVGVPLNMHAMGWWGAFSEWCVALERVHFDHYMGEGPLVIFRSRTTHLRWALHPTTGEFRDIRNRRASWRGFVMRNPDIVGALMRTLATVDRPDPSTVRTLLAGLAAATELAKLVSSDLPNARLKLNEVEGTILDALDWLP